MGILGWETGKFIGSSGWFSDQASKASDPPVIIVDHTRPLFNHLIYESQYGLSESSSGWRWVGVAVEVRLLLRPWRGGIDVGEWIILAAELR